MTVEGDACPQVRGRYSASYKLLESSGSCDQARPFAFQELEFNHNGFVSPLGELTRCSTSQVDCAVNVSCTTQIINARLDFSGSLTPDARALRGTAVLEGAYAGCFKVVYQVRAFADDDGG